MIDTTQEVHTLASFNEQPADMIRQLKATHRPITLTVDGHPEIVVQEAAAYQRLLDLAAFAEEEQAIQQGLEDMEAGRVQPLDEVFEELRVKHGIPR
ncbi:Antitoxin Phd_YefM, type II toxin-antitoxin system [Granulicella rosea]|uniref:Antitoxin Phd_YefM, type II toxin-antitoxin system n=1 Tax=Granulicella rosea TaxID=474952 RepID=A0A239HTJ5_9BACT|nr:type II toxin-antitoxin system Phd/YefM family antitoxin [Granulicella rosea]SNS84592.1 Antitoxin Phd_YefM, type II toxin-antitoxin system [Granulicella rosea]